MTPHDHRQFVPGCYRCELSRDELDDHLDLEAIQLGTARIASSTNPQAQRAAEYLLALISEVERLRADVERKDAALREALKRVHIIAAAPSETVRAAHAAMASQIVLRALSESPTETEGENG